MISLQEVPVELFAKLFHHYHEALAPDFDCAGGELPGRSWQDIPGNERGRLIAALRLALLDIGSSQAESRNHRERHFAKPGEAEWGS